MKGAIVIKHVKAQNVDADGRVQLHVILAFRELLHIDLAQVIEGTLSVVHVPAHLQFDVVPCPVFVLGFDVNDGCLIAQVSRQVERVLDDRRFDPDPQDAAEERHQQVHIVVAAKQCSKDDVVGRLRASVGPLISHGV